jgi:DnaK suppressor protein
MDTAVARKRLEEIRDEIDRSISVIERPGSPGGLASAYPQDPADAGANLTETQQTAAVLAVARRQRSEVLGALDRIKQGTYGACVDCQALVPEGRLEARPDAACCVTCQGKRDRRRR